LSVYKYLSILVFRYVILLTKLNTFYFLKSVLETSDITNLEICALLGHYAASIGKPLPTFRDNVSVPSSRVKKSSEASGDFLTLEDGTNTLSLKCR
jgi:hypothetical protein